MIGIKRQTQWYAERAAKLDYHVQGSQARNAVPYLKAKIKESELAIKAMKRYRDLKGRILAEFIYVDRLKERLEKAEPVAKAYLSRGG